MSRLESENFVDPQPPCPEFKDYVGGDFFAYQGINYGWDHRLGEGSYGEVHLFKTIANDLSRVEPPQPSFVVVKVEKGCTRNSKVCYEYGHDFSSEAEWNQAVYNLGVLAGDPKKSDQQHAILIKFIEGVTLQHVFPRTMAEMAVIFIAVVAAIQELHEIHHMIHGDIKTPNIIYGNDGKYYPIDFGLAVSIGKETGGYLAAKSEEKGEIFPHIAPECFGETCVKANASQDAYALGYLLLSMTRKVVARSRRVIQKEASDVEKIITMLRAQNPSDRLSLESVMSMLHVAFLSFVPHNPVLKQKKARGVAEKTTAVVHIAESEQEDSKSRLLVIPVLVSYSPMFVPGDGKRWPSKNPPQQAQKAQKAQKPQTQALMKF